MSTPENPVARRAAILIRTTAGTPEEIAAALDAAGMLQQPPTRINGAYPLWVRPTGLGIAIDVYPVVSAIVRELASQAAERPEEVSEELLDIADAAGAGQDALVLGLLTRLGGTDSRYATADARRLAERVLSIVGPVLPQQRRAS
ncbi:hypothetical protein ACFC26_09500 [Kitasatospora purpeofusca]|uniref:hypothetical protein n=1 Tax=Kitasatospora purpeofusca TaxID=67352 RepID=UPI0035E34035